MTREINLNLHPQALTVSRADRARLGGHAGKVMWFTGLSGSGKSTIANELDRALNEQGRRTYLLDADNVRSGLNRDLGFSDADRVENIRRTAEVASLMIDAGLIVMVALISPFERDRTLARNLIGSENFLEIYVNAPLDVCEKRDVKGLYKLARDGKIPFMTGINSAYEEPTAPNYIACTDQVSLSVLVSDILGILKSKFHI